MELLKGIDVANAINEKLIKESADMGGRVPKLAIIRVGERPDDMSYERGATKKMEKVGFACESFVFPETIENEAFQKEFDTLHRVRQRQLLKCWILREMMSQGKESRLSAEAL